MTKASKEAFSNINNTGRRTTLKKKIYDYIKRNENTHIEDMKRQLGMSHQTLTARLSDLLDEGKIEVTETKRTPNSSVKLSRYKVQEEIEKINTNAHKRKEGKYLRWKKRGETEFSEFLKQAV